MFEVNRPTKTAHLPCVRLTEEEKRFFNREARRRGLTASGLVRLAVGTLLAQSLQAPAPKGGHDAP